MADAQKTELVLQRNGRFHLICEGVSSFNCCSLGLCISWQRLYCLYQVRWSQLDNVSAKRQETGKNEWWAWNSS